MFMVSKSESIGLCVALTILLCTMTVYIEAGIKSHYSGLCVAYASLRLKSNYICISWKAEVETKQ